MNWIESLILGVLQGLTEFLPVSSSGHLELGKHFLSIEAKESLSFTVTVHGATVLSTIIVFRKDILFLARELMKFEYNDGTKFIIKILLSMIPVLILGLFFRQNIEELFSGKVQLVGAMLLFTASLLAVSNYAKQKHKPISYASALVIGIAQALAVIPGISRSGSTIAAGLLLGNKREEVARFSFLMVLLPIIGANLMDLTRGGTTYGSSVGVLPILIGFIAAFLVGLLACKWMVSIVKHGKLIYFALYCSVIGMIALFFG